MLAKVHTTSSMEKDREREKAREKERERERVRKWDRKGEREKERVYLFEPFVSTNLVFILHWVN
jgi:hypothetical protein